MFEYYCDVEITPKLIVLMDELLKREEWEVYLEDSPYVNHTIIHIITMNEMKWYISSLIHEYYYNCIVREA